MVRSRVLTMNTCLDGKEDNDGVEAGYAQSR
jgi:hypothetical protein